MATIQNSLDQIESMLATLVGGQVTKKMNPVEFVQYAHGQIAKAMNEPREQSSRRLKALHGSVQVFKDNYSSDESVNVPVYVNDTTAMDEKSTKLQTPAQAGGTPSDESAFEQGFLTKFAAIKAQFAELVKEFPPDGEEDEEEKRKKAAAAQGAGDDATPPESEDEEKRAAAGKPPFPPPKKPPFPPKKPEDMDDEEKRSAAKKGIDVSKDGTAWPEDLNDQAFQKDGKVEKSLEWGPDPS